jgi:hypothetical protein
MYVVYIGKFRVETLSSLEWKAANSAATIAHAERQHVQFVTYQSIKVGDE